MLIVPQMSLAYGSDRENILTSCGSFIDDLGYEWRILELEADPLIITEPEKDQTIQLSFDVIFAPPFEGGNNNLRVDYAIEDGGGLDGATLDEDYSCDNSCNGTLSFGRYDRTRSVIVNVIGDGVDEDDETLKLTLFNPNCDSWLRTSATIRRATINIDPAFEVLEGGNTNIPITLDSSPIEQVKVDYIISDSDSELKPDPTEYSISPYNDCGSLYFEPGVTERKIIVTAKEDNEFEQEEDFEVILYNPQGADLNTESATVSIINNTPLRQLKVEANPPIVTEPENGTEIQLPFDVSLDGQEAAPDQEITVDYAIEGGDGLYGATLNEDYSCENSCNGTLTFSPGVKQNSVIVNVIGDDVYEDDETLRLTLSNPKPLGAIAENLSKMSATSIINNNTPLRQLKVEANPPIVTEPENGTEIQLPFDVSLDGQEAAPDQEITVDYAIEGGDGLYGATLNEDYSCENSCNGTLTFSPGEKQNSVIVNVIGDDVYEENPETLKLTLSNPKPLGAIDENLSEMSATALISENGDRPMAYIANAEGVEGEQISMEVGLTKAINTEIQIGYSTDDGDAQAGEDFTDIPPQQYSLQFQPGEISQTISVETIDDALPEDDEIFYVILSDIQDVGVTVPVASVEIRDNDSGQNPEFHTTVNVRGSSAIENTRSGNVEFILYLNAPIDEEVTVNYQTRNGSARAGSDYEEKSDQCIFEKDNLECSVTVKIINDPNEEGDEYFFLKVLDSNSSSVVVFDDTLAKAEIIDDDD